jgi:hypothetical protein
MLLWTVESFEVLGEKWDLTCVVQVRFHFEKIDFQVIVCLIKSIVRRAGNNYTIV